jgi:hypothetical protein
MAVYAVEGRFGAGKTAFAVWFSRELARRRGGVPVWANFHVVGMGDVPGGQPGEGIRTFADLYNCERGVILLDELQGTIHARRSNHNLEFLAWFDQCRKQDSDVVCITQALHKIDVIVREMIDIAFSCEDRGVVEDDVGNVLAALSRITPIDMFAERARASFIFDRCLSFALYNHRERAWALVGKEDAKGSKRAQVAVVDDVADVVPLSERLLMSRSSRG